MSSSSAWTPPPSIRAPVRSFAPPDAGERAPRVGAAPIAPAPALPPPAFSGYACAGRGSGAGGGTASALAAAAARNG